MDPYPRREPGAVIPTPSQTGLPGIPILPGAGSRDRRWPVLVLPAPSLGLVGIPMYVGGRKNSGALGEAEARAGVEAGRVAKVERVGPTYGGRQSRVAGGTRQDTVPFLCGPEEQKLRFQRPGTLRCAPCSFPPGRQELAGPFPPVSGSAVPVALPLERPRRRRLCVHQRGPRCPPAGMLRARWR